MKTLLLTVETASSRWGTQKDHFLGQMILARTTDGDLMHQVDGIIYVEPPPSAAAVAALLLTHERKMLPRPT